MPARYRFSITNDFPNGVDLAKLKAEVPQKPRLSVAEFMGASVLEEKDAVDFTFAAALTAADQVELQAVVDEHTGSEG